MALLLVLLPIIFWTCWIPSLRCQTQNLTVVVLVNSNNATGYNTDPANPGEYQRYPERYFEHLQIPYQVVDVSAASPENLGQAQLIVAAHRGLSLPAAWQQAITAAVAGGTGFVNLDNDPAIGTNSHIQAIFGATGSAASAQAGHGIVIPASVLPGGSTPHFIDALQMRFPAASAGDLTYSFHYNDTGVVGGATATNLKGSQATVVAKLDDGDPLILATTYQAGRAVYFSTYDYLRPDRFGFLIGVDDLFWRSLVWAARKPFVVRGYPRFFAVQMDDGDFHFPMRMADLWNTSLTGTVNADGTGGPFKVTGNFALHDFSLAPADRPQLIAGIQAGDFKIGPHANNIDVEGGDFYWNSGAPNTDSQWQTKLAQMLTWKLGDGGSDSIPAFSRSMVPHWFDLSNNAGYDMWNSLGQRYVTTIQTPGTYYLTGCKTDQERLMLRPFRLYELPPADCDPAEEWPVYYADDLPVGSTAGRPPQTFFGFATLPPGSNEWPQSSGWTVAQSLQSFERNTWTFWSALGPYEMYTHDDGNYENASVSDRDAVITQFSAWLKPLGVRHLFMDQLGDYIYARNKSTLVSAQATSSGVTLTFTGRSTDPDGNPIATQALLFSGDGEGSWVNIPGFTAGTIVTIGSTSPVLGIGAAAIHFSASAGGSNPPSQTVSISNLGGGTLNWSTSSDSAWLSASPASGTKNATLTLTANISGLSVGTYTGNVTVSAPAATNSPQQIAVTLVIAGPQLSSIAVTPANTSITKGATRQFTATGTYSDGSTKNITTSATWLSTNPAVATMAGAVATAVGSGTTNIQATLGSVSGSTGLTVIAPTLTSIAVTPANTSVNKGATQQFTATGTYSDGTTQNITGTVTWTSTSAATATISSAGLATAVTAGNTTIRATSGTISGSTGLTVTVPVLRSIAITPANPVIPRGVSQQFAATGTYSDGSTQNLTATVTWTSSRRTVATISSSGLALGVAEGSTTITATSGSIKGTTELTVSSVALQSIAVTPVNQSIGKGATQPFMATGTYSDGSTQNLTSTAAWSSTNTAVATIVSGGLAIAVAPGSTTIRATFGTLTGSTTLTVTTAALKSIAVTPANPSISEGATQQFTATGTYTDGSTQNLTASVTWVSTHTTVATVATGGLATAVGAGSTSIQATAGSITGSASLTVTAPTLTSIAVTPVNGSIAKGLTQQFTATGTYTDGSTQNLTASVTWMSTNPAVATIVGGVASAIAVGTTSIQATSGSVSGSTNLTVTAPTLTSISVTPANSSIAKGLTQQFTATGTYSDGSAQNLTASVTWMSTNPAVATIAGGVASAIGVGTTSIQATSGSVTGGTGLTVTAPTLVSITLTPVNDTISAGVTQQFAATGTFSDGGTQNLTNAVTWSSTNSGVATISAGGSATGVAGGSTTIIATLGPVSGSTMLTVLTVTLQGQFVQWTAGDGGSTTHATTYQSKSATRGDLILVLSHWDNQSITASVSDNLGNTYTPLGGPSKPGTSAAVQVWYAKNIKGGVPLAVTVSYSAKTTSFALIDVAEYSGLDTTAPLDGFASATGSGNSQSSAPVLTSTSNETIIGFFGYDGFALPYTAGSGFKLRSYDATSMLEDMGVSTTGTYSATANSNASASWAAYVIAMRNAN